MRHPLLHLILLSLGTSGCGAREDSTGCMPVDAGVTTCPPADEVSADQLADPWDCDNKVVKVVDDLSGVPEPAFYDGSSGCCYAVVSKDTQPGSECIVGRPYREGDRTVMAPAPAGDPWASIAAGEHASIAAFAKLQLQLLAHGAPLELVARVADALRDEVRHAEVALSFSGLAALDAVPFTAPIVPRGPLATLAAETVRDGCIGETLSALATRAAAQAATDPTARRALHDIADDEDRHAALSWSIVAWALHAGGPEVHDAVLHALRVPHPTPRFDLLEAEALEAVMREGLAQVIAPAATALLAA